MISTIESILKEIDRKIERNGKSIGDFLKEPEIEDVYSFADPPENVVINGSYDKHCWLVFGKKALNAIKSKRCNLTISSMAVSGRVVEGAFVYIEDIIGRVQILFGSGGSVILGSLGSVAIDARIGLDGILIVGDNTTINGARIVAVNSNILVGKDGLWSDEILAQGFDQHGIVDVDTQEIINSEKRDIVIDEHVWIGRRVTLMPKVTIGKGSIVGTCAVVTKPLPSFSSSAGVPAKVVRNRVSWSRPWTGLDAATKLFLDEQSPEIESTIIDDL